MAPHPRHTDSPIGRSHLGNGYIPHIRDGGLDRGITEEEAEGEGALAGHRTMCMGHRYVGFVANKDIFPEYVLEGKMWEDRNMLCHSGVKPDV